MEEEKISEVEEVERKLKWMSEEHIFPNGLRYLWTDSFGVCNYISLYKKTGEEGYIKEAESLIEKVYKVLGRPKGLRIGEEADRDGQYFHYLTKWMFALNEIGKIKPEYHEKSISLIKDIHPKFVIAKKGVCWKMAEDLSAPYPGYGMGGLDFYDGYTMYNLIDPVALSSQIGDMQTIIDYNYKDYSCTQDLGLGEVLWMTHFFPLQPWAKLLYQRSIHTLDSMWVDMGQLGGYFCRQPGHTKTKFAFTNFGVSVGLQSLGLFPDRVQKLNQFFATYKSHDEYDTNSITHVMHCTSIFPGVFIKSFS